MKLLINGIIVQGEAGDIADVLEQLIYHMGTRPEGDADHA